MKLHIPNSAFIGNIESFTSKLDLTNEGVLDVTSNENWISVHPVVIAMVIALAKEVNQNKGLVTSQGFTAKSRSYLLRMGLIGALDPDHGILMEEHESSGRFIQARQILTSVQLNEFITDMVPLLHTTPEQAYPIKYVMSELVRNVIEHSQSEIGAIVCAQYFKKTNRISIGVADRGIGIKQAINYSHRAISNKDALALALRPGITGTTSKIGGTEFNAGAGLFFTKSIAKISRDYFFIYSGDSFFKLHKTPHDKTVNLPANPEEDKGKFKTDVPFWKGTVVGLDISMDVNKDFEELLEMIRHAYHLDIKHSAKDKYRKPKFL